MVYYEHLDGYIRGKKEIKNKKDFFFLREERLGSVGQRSCFGVAGVAADVARPLVSSRSSRLHCTICVRNKIQIILVLFLTSFLVGED